MLDLGAGGWAIAVLAASAVGLSKGGLVMTAALGVPILSLIMSPVQAAGLLLPVYIASDVGGLIAFRRDWDARVIATILPAAVVGITLGGFTAHLVPERLIGALVGVIGLSFALMALLRPRLVSRARAPDWRRGGFWGMLTGYTSFVSHSGSPPYQVYVQPLGLSPLRYAGTTTICFAAINLVKLIPYGLLGQLSAANLSTAALLAVPALASVWVGVRLVRILPERLYYILISWMLLLVSLRLIWTGLLAGLFGM